METHVARLQLLTLKKMSLLEVSVLKLLNKELARGRQSSHDDHNNLFPLLTFLTTESES